ncbi:MAG TPA: hypothetical protein VKE50_11905 [Thermoanaerobaculia bacterium]|nr:hypothetical protein [Thermoanaerobaculia bacterium]
MRLQRAILVLILASPAIPPPSMVAERERTVTCALSNSAYSGWCRVTEAVPADSTPAAVCGSVLACLNDTACTKTYCDATQIRGGWKLEKVESSPAGDGK